MTPRESSINTCGVDDCRRAEGAHRKPTTNADKGSLRTLTLAADECSDSCLSLQRDINAGTLGSASPRQLPHPELALVARGGKFQGKRVGARTVCKDLDALNLLKHRHRLLQRHRLQVVHVHDLVTTAGQQRPAVARERKTGGHTAPHIRGRDRVTAPHVQDASTGHHSSAT